MTELNEFDLGLVVGEDGVGISDIDISDGVLTIAYTDGTEDEFELDFDGTNTKEISDITYSNGVLTFIFTDLTEKTVEIGIESESGKFIEDISIENNVMTITYSDESTDEFELELVDGKLIENISVEDNVMTITYSDESTDEFELDIEPTTIGKVVEEISMENNIITITYSDNSTKNITINGGGVLTSHSHGNISNEGKVGTTSGKPLVTTTGGTITTGSFGTGSGDFAKGDHTHSGYASSSHTHGDISNDGKIGSTSGKPLMTTTGGKIGIGSFGTGSGDFAKGDHTHSEYAQLDNNGKIPSSLLPVDTNGNVDISVDSQWANNSANPVESRLIQSALNEKVDKSNGASQITDSQAYSNIGSEANATQATINGKLDSYILGQGAAIQAIWDRILEVAGELNALEGNLADFNQALLTFNGDTTNLSTDLTKLKGNLESILLKLGDLQKDSGDFGQFMEQFQPKIEVLSDTLSALYNGLTNFEGTLDQFKTRLQQQGVSYDELDNGIKTLLELIFTSKENIKAVEEDIGDRDGSQENTLWYHIKQINDDLDPDVEDSLAYLVNEAKDLIGSESQEDSIMWLIHKIQTEDIPTLTNLMYGSGEYEPGKPYDAEHPKEGSIFYQLQYIQDNLIQGLIRDIAAADKIARQAKSAADNISTVVNKTAGELWGYADNNNEENYSTGSILGRLHAAEGSVGSAETSLWGAEGSESSPKPGSIWYRIKAIYDSDTNTGSLVNLENTVQGVQGQIADTGSNIKETTDITSSFGWSITDSMGYTATLTFTYNNLVRIAELYISGYVTTKNGYSDLGITIDSAFRPKQHCVGLANEVGSMITVRTNGTVAGLTTNDLNTTYVNGQQQSSRAIGGHLVWFY